MATVCSVSPALMFELEKESDVLANVNVNGLLIQSHTMGGRSRDAGELSISSLLSML